MSEKNLFFSVVIPLYNKRPYILRAVNAVLNQTYENFEVLIIDDGSTDGSRDELTSLEDQRVKIIVKKNGGAASARNRGIKEAKGEYIALLDADDEWDKLFLETIVKMITKFPDAGLFATANRHKYQDNSEKKIVFTDKKNEISLIKDYFEIIAKSGTSINNSSSSVVPKKVFEKVGLFPEGMIHYEDHAVWYKIALTYDIAYFFGDLVTIHKNDINLCASNASAVIKKDSIERLFNELQKSVLFDNAPSHKQNVLIKLLNQRILSVLKQMVKEKELVEARHIPLKSNIDFLSKIIYASQANIITYYTYSIAKNLGLKK